MTKSRRKRSAVSEQSASRAEGPVAPVVPAASAFEPVALPSRGVGEWAAESLRVLVRRRVPAGLAFAGVVLGIGTYLYGATPVFEARSQLLIQVEAFEPIRFRDAVDRDQLTTDDYQTQYSILKSRNLARRTIDSLKLWDAPEFAPVTSLRTRAEHSAPKDAGPAPASPQPDAAGSTPDTVAAGTPPEVALQTKIIDNFLKQLSVEPVVNSRLVDVRFRSRDPELAARVANTLSHAYINQNVESRFESARTAAAWLEQQLAEQRARLETGQQNLQRYRERNPGTGVENTQNVVAQKVADLNAALTRAETNRIEKESTFERLRAAGNDLQALEASPAILGNRFIQELKTELAALQRRRQDQSQLLGQRHPEMVKLSASIATAEARLRSEVDKVVQAVESEYLAARAQEERLRTELASQQQAATAQDRRAVNYGVLQREVASSQQLFDSLLQRAKEIGVAGEFRSTNVRIVDEAEVPQVRVWPPKLAGLLFAFLAGSSLALLTAFGLERLDTRVKSPAEIREQLGLPYLALVPEIDEALTATLTATATAPAIAGAFEELAKSVMNATSPGVPRIVMVGSAGMGEGKSLVAANMAAAMASAGQRVLLVDADLRRPRVHQLCEVEKTPGLTEVCAGQAKVDEVLQPTKSRGLWAMAAGHSSSATSAVFGDGQRLRALLSDLGHSGAFDWIVIDVPPTLVVGDGALIARDVAGVVFVVSATDTKREVARLAIDRLDAAGATFFGAVLNRADVTRHGYYFAPYYRPEYSSYYRPQPNGGIPAHPGEESPWPAPAAAVTVAVRASPQPHGTAVPQRRRADASNAKENGTAKENVPAKESLPALMQQTLGPPEALAPDGLVSSEPA